MRQKLLQGRMLALLLVSTIHQELRSWASTLTESALRASWQDALPQAGIDGEQGSLAGSPPCSSSWQS